MRLTAVVVLLLLLVPRALRAQNAQNAPNAQNATDACAALSSSLSSSSSPSHRWSAPLDRIITIAERGLPLEDALMRVAQIANIHLSFSSDLLPPGRIACMSYQRIAAGDVLAFMLRDAGLALTVAGSDQVVVTRARADRSAVDSSGSARVFQLGRVLGTADAQRAIAERTPTFSVTILDASSAGWRQDGSLVEVLNANVPGMWVWTGSSGGITANYGSTRGTSSFGISSPKILIDGIEVANSLLLSRITMDAVERIEIIRGPQGSARYGADALNGVTNIITRHNTSSSVTPHVRASSAVGMAASRYSSNNAVTQDHTVRMEIGRTARSFDLDLGLGSIGAYAPGAGASHANADAALRFIGAKTVVTGTLRYLSQSIDTTGSASALLAFPDAGLASAFSDAAVTEALSLREYTAGFNAAYAHSERWTHSVVLGIDGYRLGGVSYDSVTVASAIDAVLRDAGSRGARTTLRANSIARFGAPNIDATLTFTGDHTRISQRDDNLPVFQLSPPPDDSTRGGGGGRDGARSGSRPGSAAVSLFAPDNDLSTQLRTSTGVSAELGARFREALSLTGALRLERASGGTAGTGRSSALPMLGAAYSVRSGAAEIKLRSSYGKGVRWPSLGGLRDHMQLTRMSLEPEQQTGFEAGVDVYVARSLSLQLTHFDQTATGLAQQVTLRATERGRGPGGPRFGIEMQSVGAISNNGWELQGTVRRGIVSLASAATFLDSRVLRLADAYTGDLRVGDHPLAVPARTISMSAAVARPEWSASLTTFRAASWINYDRIAMTRAQAASDASSTILDLRQFWRSYAGFTHVNLNATRAIRSGFVLSVGASNLLNRQTGEPDNASIVPGRTYSVGLRAIF